MDHVFALHLSGGGCHTRTRKVRDCERESKGGPDFTDGRRGRRRRGGRRRRSRGVVLPVSQNIIF